MKPSSILATALAIVFWCVLPAAADNRLDITLEGPWILYEYTNPNFAGGKTVLVAITPGGVVPDYPEGSSMQQDPKLFHHVSLRTGDGYFIQRANIYCLAFEDKSGLHCGDFGNGTRLDPDGYPPAAGPLQVKVSQNWQWTHLTTATALILPMPNSYSNDGVWPMRFGRAYHPSGFEYKPWKTPKHSIAVQLHYENGPSGFNLFMCSDDLRKCTLPTGIDHTALENTGTLRIVMKSPENEDVCDLHVRHAYPRMLALLDLPNPEIAVIDPARGVKNDGAGDYDDPLNCLPNDEQGHALHEVPKPEKPPKLSKLTMDVVRALNRLADKAPDKKDELLLPKIATDIASASAGLDDDFPRISQLDKIGQLVKLSAGKIELVMMQLEAQLRVAAHSEQSKASAKRQVTEANSEPLATLKLALAAERAWQSAAPTKSGNDCRAPIMVAQP